MMRRRQSGVSLLEVLIVLAIIGVALGVLAEAFGRSNRDYAVQRQLSDATQNAEVASALLIYDLKTAGFAGDDTTASAASITSANVATYLSNVISWPFTPYSSTVTPDPGTLKLSSVNVNTLIANSGPSTSECGATTPCDVLTLTRVSAEAPASASGYKLEQITYTVKNTSSTMPGLYRLSQKFDCTSAFACTADTTYNNATANTTAELAVEGVEDFQVYFVSTGGAYTTTPPTGPAQASTASPTVNTTSAIGVYLRVRAPTSDGSVTDARTYPTIALPTSQTSTTLGIPSRTYSGTDRNYRRIEKLLTVSTLNKQSVR
ncbi:prepilin-type N-terminal cleavage/methylation domain-containing protein [Deinococcus yavapaiensis]|uniref:Prepilin-type N-terminal cleavage/methylation domain-containing protein n=1 Tax=Deinococcus yavapaiensis KR-236 TaxID=694435 RepID=A0A318SBA7_9DEIO|nr:prepilin-type N-terminal cleavage/methylation domain-containing protein [Deinococcus yavapaiensis]PYE53569.1 prepilin-type N-terminal cleavage/methylation domain-containing protein [Deinococcus yavapaiensis KR-236]